MKGIFITGTDTNVGKTYVACKIAAALKKQNINVIPRKPVESGCQLIDGELIPDDALKLQLASQSNETLNTICPYRFQQAISPARAARLNNQKISIEQLIRTCITQTNSNDFLLVEGAGGIYSPICENALNADLAKKINLPLLLIAEDKIGCINQVLLCLQAAQHQKLEIKTIVLNDISNSNQINNAEELALFTQIPIFRFNAGCSTNELISCIL